MQKFNTDDVHYPDLGSASDWVCSKGIFFQPIGSTTKIWLVHFICMEFLRSILRRRFARAKVATLQNGGCFLRLLIMRLVLWKLPEFSIFQILDFHLRFSSVQPSGHVLKIKLFQFNFPTYRS